VKVDYTFENESGDSVFFRAVHSIRPMEAAKEFQLIQCFCFEDQPSGLTRGVLPVYFALSPRFPSNVNELILNYSLFPRDPNQSMPDPATAANWTPDEPLQDPKVRAKKPKGAGRAHGGLSGPRSLGSSSRDGSSACLPW
jgi:hypothetical protein